MRLLASRHSTTLLISLPSKLWSSVLLCYQIFYFVSSISVVEMILNRDLTTTGTSTTPFTSVPFATSSSSPTGGGSPRNTTDFAKVRYLAALVLVNPSMQSALEYIFLALAIFLLTSSIWLRFVSINYQSITYLIWYIQPLTNPPIQPTLFLLLPLSSYSSSNEPKASNICTCLIRCQHLQPI